jgi:hypothetical protein
LVGATLRRLTERGALRQGLRRQAGDGALTADNILIVQIGTPIIDEHGIRGAGTSQDDIAVDDVLAAFI